VIARIKEDSFAKEIVLAQQLTPDQLHQFARLGAVARLAQINAEIAAIRRIFPELVRRRRGLRATPARLQTAVASRPKREWSDEDRKAVSDRMKKYWADRRKTRKTAR
jgi:hypothetical protein